MRVYSSSVGLLKLFEVLGNFNLVDRLLRLGNEVSFEFIVLTGVGVLLVTVLGPGGDFVFEKDGNFRDPEVAVTTELLQLSLSAPNSVQSALFVHLGKGADLRDL